MSHCVNKREAPISWSNTARSKRTYGGVPGNGPAVSFFFLMIDHPLATQKDKGINGQWINQKKRRNRECWGRNLVSFLCPAHSHTIT
jgi:hypothetical protein